MIKLIWDSDFKKSYKERIKKNSKLKKKFWEAMELFSNDQFDSTLKVHKLTGKLIGMWAFSVDSDCRIIFKFEDNEQTALLIDIGSHQEVY